VPLTTHAPIAFIPTLDAKAARAFYEDTLGLNFEFHLQPLVG
jgi:catechol 2,3-dioxygenase-like lactoylglutathione lyase family enzyme